ncbi:MAG TPA: NAD(P)H-binding protein [Vicinamibacterales bacterium]|jgi:uncharacterized protein YbjT (DUF2867 family)|nr:NAD(P)H-binding protein [Vicinamibacterales bacterium]
MNRILVIGATGNIGRNVVTRLTAAGARVRAMVRDPELAGLPPQVEVVHGDLTHPDTLNESLRGIEAVFLVWTAPAAAAAPALECITRRARRTVYLSAPLKTPHPFFQASLPNPMSVLHEEIERLIQQDSAEWTFLRPGMLASNALGWWAPQIRTGDVVRWPYLAAPTAPIDERDIASVAVRALLDGGHGGADYVLTGPQSLSQFEQVSTIGHAIGRPLKIEEMSPEEARREWAPTWPPPVVNMLLKSWAAAVGQPAYVTSTVAEVTGTPARTYADWASDHADAFRA